MPSPVNDWTGTLIRPWHTFVFGGPSARPSSTTVEFSMDTISGRAQCQFAGDPRISTSGFPAVDINQHCWVQGGYRDASSAESNELLFDGFIEDDGSGYSSSALRETLSLGDRLMLTQFSLGDPQFDQSPWDLVTTYDGTILLDPAGGDPSPSPYNNAPDGGWTDILIVKDLLARSGVAPSADDSLLAGIGGLGITIGQNQGIGLTSKTKPGDLISQVDQATGCKTFSTPAGPKRIVTTFSPNTEAAWTLREGYEILSVQNKRSIKNYYNRVIVKGLKLGGSQPLSIIQHNNPNLPPVAGGSPLSLPYNRNAVDSPITYVFQSDLIQSQDHADRLAQSLITVGDRVERRISITTNFNPYANPGQTVAVYAPHAKVFSTTNCFAFGIKHTFDSGGAHTAWDIACYD